MKHYIGLKCFFKLIAPEKMCLLQGQSQFSKARNSKLSNINKTFCNFFATDISIRVLNSRVHRSFDPARLTRLGIAPCWLGRHLNLLVKLRHITLFSHKTHFSCKFIKYESFLAIKRQQIWFYLWFISVFSFWRENFETQGALQVSHMSTNPKMLG